PILADYAVGILPLLLLGYLAWWMRREYWHDLDDEAERDLHQRAAGGNRWAFWVIVKDRLEFLALFLALVFGFVAFSGAATASPKADCARDTLVRWEVSSQSQYLRRWQWAIWPGGASGITWGVGYDGGHQHRQSILREWAMHAHRDRLATTAGITGEAARLALPRYRDIVTPWPMAVHVLEAYSIPRYWAAARRAYGRQIDRAPAGVQCALISETYNRGEAMAGARRAERRTIRDQCLPARDAECVARALEASCRVWAADAINGPGLCNRRRAEASIARSTP
ncbi:hypothetical protein, partial [Ralstonia sp.]|uniref:hypothetical protein n=1 Tax=Ralstonia sp. TaxID=54061 RepID=UPI00257C6609